MAVAHAGFGPNVVLRRDGIVYESLAPGHPGWATGLGFLFWQRGLLFREEAGPTGLDIKRLSMNQPDQPKPLLDTPSNELNAEISPDGRWLAFTSNESGREEVYVRPFPNVDAGLSLVSPDGGEQPVWALDGRALFYRARDGALMHVPVELTPTFSARTPERLLERGFFLGGPGRSYDVAPDGKHFLLIKASSGAGELSGPPSIVVVHNWIEELERLVPTN